jgi:hypothetical protein
LIIYLATPIGALCVGSKCREALKRMEVGKAMGPDGIPIKVWRCLGDLAIVWLTKMFNNIY